MSEFDTKLRFEETKQLLASSMVQRNWTARLAHLFLKIDADGDPLWLEQVFRYDGDLSDRPPLPIEKKRVILINDRNKIAFYSKTRSIFVTL